jgi:lysozyme
MCLLVGCHADVAKNVRAQRASADDAPALCIPEVDTAHSRIYKIGVAKEIEYYMSRHDSTDEGYDMVEHYLKKGHSAMATYVPEAPLRLTNVGRWRHFSRQGTGMVRDALGRVILGVFENDTLVCGIRIDSVGIYAGHLTRNGEAEGHGVYRSWHGTYFEGHWYMDMREGYGISVSDNHLHVGRWRKNRFLGERMHHTPDRIYGIDISRYQHERGRRRFPIAWSDLRITGLGHRIGSQRVSGAVDYPVSFVYIKSTEGISIKNRYFESDYETVRRLGIPVGAYHFFSTRQDVSAQATYFLQNSRFHRGDLPPILDVEPSDVLIRQMGGPEALFKALRLWLRRVEARVGVKPILYVNQQFVRNYLSLAPDIKRDYQVWIARYGEYKPDGHLTFWQLSSDGRVRGIRTEVDVNVFNGYQSQWDDFLREETIK